MHFIRKQHRVPHLYNLYKYYILFHPAQIYVYNIYVCICIFVVVVVVLYRCVLSGINSYLVLFFVCCIDSIRIETLCEPRPFFFSIWLKNWNENKNNKETCYTKEFSVCNLDKRMIIMIKCAHTHTHAQIRKLSLRLRLKSPKLCHFDAIYEIYLMGMLVKC